MTSNKTKITSIKSMAVNVEHPPYKNRMIIMLLVVVDAADAAAM